MEDIDQDFIDELDIDEEFVEDYDNADSDNEDDNESFDDDKSRSSEESEENENEENDNEEITVNDFEQDETSSFKNSKPSSVSLLRNKLTKYEFTRLFGLRVTQIYHGASPMVEINENMSVEDIVKKEFVENRIPLLIERTLPKDKNNKEYRRLSELFNVVAH